MKKNMIFFLIIAMFFAVIACDEDKENPVDAKVDKSKGMFINESQQRPAGVDTLFINTGDTITATASTIFEDINEPEFSWVAGDDSKLKIVETDDDAVVSIIALADSGVATTLTLFDAANDAQKTIPVVVTRLWADPLLYRYIGSLNGHKYYISRFIRVWPAARDLCEEAGGHLVTITSSEENNLVMEGKENKTDNVWIGLAFKDINDSNLKYWYNGEEMTFKPGGDYAGKPDIFAELYFYIDEKGHWISWHEVSYLFCLEME